MKRKKSKEMADEIVKRVKYIKDYYDPEDIHGFTVAISKCPYCGYVCDVPDGAPSLLNDVCIHFHRGEKNKAIFRREDANASRYINPFVRY